jgi:hypothetical protein
MQSVAQFRIAVRIHYALRPHLGEDIDVASLLRRSDEAREVMLVCRSIGTPELLALADQYEVAAREAAEAEAAKHQAAAPQDLGWSRNTSGFAVSQPPVQHEAQAPRRRWFGFGAAAR